MTWAAVVSRHLLGLIFAVFPAEWISELHLTQPPSGNPLALSRLLGSVSESHFSPRSSSRFRCSAGCSCFLCRFVPLALTLLAAELGEESWRFI